MLKETIKNFIKNIRFFVIVLSIVILSILLSALLRKNTQMEEVEELPDNINMSTNKVIINEIQSSNGGTYADENGNTYDWIELYNGSSKDKDLTGYSLSDKNNEIKWVFPDGTIIPSKGYIIIFLSGTRESGLYANFKLKASGGEVLALRNAKKKVIDAIETVAVSKNQVMARMEDGNFAITNMPTPGYENSKEGYEKFTSVEEYSKDKSISITEILPNNKGYFKDSFGNYSGYIELTNISEDPVSLKGYTVSNNESIPYRWALPDIVLGKNESIVLYTSNKNSYEEEYHTNFKLDNTDGVVILSNKNKIEEKVVYTALANGLAYIKGGDTFYESNMISPGYLNNSTGITEFQKKYYVKNNDLIINEVMNSNYSYLAQNGNNYYDWIELYNNSKNTLSLKDYYITTTTNNPKKYNLPDVELKPGNYYILMASGDINLSNNSYKHTNFKISDNEGLFLYKKGKVVDSLFISNVPVGNSYGRGSSNGLYYFNNPTPNKANGSGNMQISYTPLFSKEAGVYNNIESLDLNLYCNGTLYYTTDGNTPSKNSKVYKDTLNLTKTTVVKAMCSESGKLNSKIVTKSYIINENHTLPVMSISISNSDYNSILSHAWTTGYEKAAYAELFEDDNSFSSPVGFKLFGGSARSERKKSFTIKFKKKYGNGSLNYQVFDNRDNAVYDSLVIRSGSQDNTRAIIRDILGTSLVDGKINVDVQAYKSIILYLNGKYHGVYFIREKVDENFIASHYNVDGTKSDIIRIDGGVIYGSRSKYNKLINYITSHNMANSTYYNEVAKMIDIDSVIDFWVAEAYVTNNDIINCKLFTNPDVDDGRFKYIFFDLDFAFYNYFVNYYSFSTASSMHGIPTTILRNLMKNDDFKKRYLERVSYQLKEVWNEERIMERYNEILEEIEPEMTRDLSRWGITRSKWNYELGRLKTYIQKRSTYMKSQTKSYFKLSNAEYNKYFGD